MYLNLGISMILKNFKLSRIEEVDFDSSVDAFKNRVAEKINFPKETIELAYCGQILNDSSTLKANGLREGFVVNVLQKKERDNTPQPLPVLESEIPDLVRVFQILATRNAYRRVLQQLNKPDVLENIISTTPGLSDDAVAIVILQHPELIAKLGDANAVKKVVEEHPTLANAARNLVAAVQNDMLTSPSTSTSSAHNLSNNVSFIVGSDDEEMEIMGNGDSQNRTLESSDDGEQPVNLITTSQVAAALANTSAAGTPSRSAAGGSTASITSEMMSAALQQAIIASTSTAVTTSTASASTSTSPPAEETKEESPVTLAKLEELRKLGFTNDASNIQALQIANGDLETAVNLILSGLNEDN